VTAFNVAVSIDAPPKRVLAVLCDVERWPEWTSTVTHVQRLDRGPFAVGSSAPGVQMKAGHLVEASGGGSRAALSFEVSGFLSPIVSRLYRGLIQEYVATEAQGLKLRSEMLSRLP